MRIALALQTCDREAYTVRTLASFAAHNDLSQFALVHADDASASHANADLALAYGFRTVVQTRERQGMRSVRLALIDAASKVASWVLLLENDIETLRLFPWPLFHYARTSPAIYCVRLYGRYKDTARTDACLATHKRLGHRPVQWRPFRDAPEKSQIGQIHWSAQPAVTRVAPLLHLHRTGEEPDGLTVRVKKNAMAHFGVDRTPGRLQ